MAYVKVCARACKVRMKSLQSYSVAKNADISIPSTRGLTSASIAPSAKHRQFLGEQMLCGEVLLKARVASLRGEHSCLVKVDRSRCLG